MSPGQPNQSPPDRSCGSRRPVATPPAERVDTTRPPSTLIEIGRRLETRSSLAMMGMMGCRGGTAILSWQLSRVRVRWVEIGGLELGEVELDARRQSRRELKSRQNRRRSGHSSRDFSSRLARAGFLPPKRDQPRNRKLRQVTQHRQSADDQRWRVGHHMQRNPKSNSYDTIHTERRQSQNAQVLINANLPRRRRNSRAELQHRKRDQRRRWRHIDPHGSKYNVVHRSRRRPNDDGPQPGTDHHPPATHPVESLEPRT